MRSIDSIVSSDITDMVSAVTGASSATNSKAEPSIIDNCQNFVDAIHVGCVFDGDLRTPTNKVV